ncbi:MAG: GlsB/YeaQ/YmgE family stress response membrane protein [Opitutaceae bacterium]|jgi:uncharacterized membrane protein YeaQ/YmgE (transglycosylase-associated protein family)|nr:GlsB/YeaQ/YmgE family stress response membrane protein [Opitutaceae bacterium]
MSFEQLCILLVVGGLAGWLAGLILHRRGFGLVGNLVIGVIGSFLGRFALGVVGFHAASTLAQVITAVLGALLLLWLLSFIPRGRKKK